MINNACDRPLFANSGTMPDVSGAIYDYFQKMLFEKITKSVVNSQNVEVTTPLYTLGLWQPMKVQMIAMKPEGQRKWKWFILHAAPALANALFPDDVINYLGVQYRVAEKFDWSLNGYVEYHIVDDYEGSGPR